MICFEIKNRNLEYIIIKIKKSQIPLGIIKKIKNKNKYTVSVPHVQILLTELEEGPKVEESQMIGTESKLFFYRD